MLVVFIKKAMKKDSQKSKPDILYSIMEVLEVLEVLKRAKRNDTARTINAHQLRRLLSSFDLELSNSPHSVSRRL